MSKEWKLSVVRSQKDTRHKYLGNDTEGKNLKKWKGLYENIPNAESIFAKFKYYGNGLRNIPLRLELLVATAQKLGKKAAEHANSFLIQAGCLSGGLQFKEDSIRHDDLSKRYNKLLKTDIVMERNYPEIVQGLLTIVRTEYAILCNTQEAMTMSSLIAELNVLEERSLDEKRSIAETQIDRHFWGDESFVNELQDFLMAHIECGRLKRFISDKDQAVLIELCEGAKTEFEGEFWKHMISRFDKVNLIHESPKVLLSRFLEFSMRIVWISPK